MAASASANALRLKVCQCSRSSSRKFRVSPLSSYEVELGRGRLAGRPGKKVACVKRTKNDGLICVVDIYIRSGIRMLCIEARELGT